MRKIRIDNELKYSDIPVDKEGWANAKEYMPEDFSLCYLKIKDREHTQIGWSNGLAWDGLKIRKGDEVLSWKLKREQRER